MTPAEIRAARETLGLTPQQFADMLELGHRSAVYALQCDGGRQLPTRAERLLRAYLSGYRPEDWPK